MTILGSCYSLQIVCMFICKARVGNADRNDAMHGFTFHHFAPHYGGALATFNSDLPLWVKVGFVSKPTQ